MQDIDIEFGFNLDPDDFTGRELLIPSHSSARFFFELSGNSN